MLIVAATERELVHVRHARTLVCGIGPVEAAATTARALAERAPSAVLHVGIAGARSLPPLSVVLGSESVYCDIAAAIPVVDRAEPDAALLARVHGVLRGAIVAPIGTSGAVGRGTYDVEAMEGFGVLRACALAGVPAVELRVVSNELGERDRSRWRFDEAFAVIGDAVARVVDR